MNKKKESKPIYLIVVEEEGVEGHHIWIHSVEDLIASYEESDIGDDEVKYYKVELVPTREIKDLIERAIPAIEEQKKEAKREALKKQLARIQKQLAKA